MKHEATKPVTTALLMALALAAAPALAGGAGGAAMPDLSRRLEKEASRAGGAVAVHVSHLPSGRWAASNATRVQPLYSVFKLPVAVTVLKEVEAGRLALDRPVEVTAGDMTPKQAAANPRWSRLPVVLTVKDLLDLSIVDSDNASTDKLLDLVGGPAAVMRTLKALDLAGASERRRVPGRSSTAGGREPSEGPGSIDVQFRCREQSPGEGRLNRGSAAAMTRLLVQLQTGALLKPPQRALLLDMMTRSQTGLRRLRGHLPPGTVVASKTGTGLDGAVTNDVGLIALPGGEHLAISVLISGSKLTLDEQSRLIADLARLAYDAFAPRAD
jgi:beta-lactamase class A